MNNRKLFSIDSSFYYLFSALNRKLNIIPLDAMHALHVDFKQNDRAKSIYDISTVGGARDFDRSKQVLAAHNQKTTLEDIDLNNALR